MKGIIILAFVTLSCYTSQVFSDDHQIIFGIHPYKSTSAIYDSFGPLVKVLSKKLQMEIKIFVAPSYDQHIANIKKDKYHFFYVGPASYTMVLELPHNPIGVLEVDGSPYFHGHYITYKKNKISSLKELKGKSFAFTSPQSTMGHIVPRYELNQQGLTIDDFSEHKFLGTHDNVALAVLSGHYFAGVVKENIYFKYAKRGLKSITKTRPIPEHVFAASLKLSEQQFKIIKETMLSLEDSYEGKNILYKIKKSATAITSIKKSSYQELKKIVETFSNGNKNTP